MDLYHFADFATEPKRFKARSNCPKHNLQPARMNAIAEPIARRHGFTMKEIVGPSRRRVVSAARFEVMHALMSERLWSSLTVGEFLGKRDHSTVLNGVRRHEERLALREAAA